MTLQDCQLGIDRLAKAWSIVINKDQAAIIHQRLQHIPSQVWRHAIDELLVNYLIVPRNGFLAALMKAVDDAQEQSRRTRLSQDRVESERVLNHGPRNIHGMSDMDRSFGQMFWRGITRGLKSDGHYAETMRDEILAWINVPENAAWAKTQPCDRPGLGTTNWLSELMRQAQLWDDRAKANGGTTLALTVKP